MMKTMREMLSISGTAHDSRRTMTVSMAHLAVLGIRKR